MVPAPGGSGAPIPAPPGLLTAVPDEPTKPKPAAPKPTAAAKPTAAPKPAVPAPVPAPAASAK